jgi:hypothetical protein
MSGRVRELAERQAELQLRCAVERRVIAAELHSVEARLDRVDRAASTARTVLRNPAVIAGGIVALLMLGRVGGFRLLGRAYLLMSATRRLVNTIRFF